MSIRGEKREKTRASEASNGDPVATMGRRFKIPSEMLATAGVRHESDLAVRELLVVHGRSGQDLSGIVFPYPHPYTRSTKCYRVRLDHELEGHNGHKQKYLSSQGCRELYFPPVPPEYLTDTSIPVVPVEAEKSSLALTALAERSGRKLLVIAIGGVWGFLRTNGKKLQTDGTSKRTTGPSPSLDLITWKDRPVILMLDSNVAGCPDLKRARLALARLMSKRGANVCIASVRERGREQKINGPDDMVAVLGDAAVLALIDNAGAFCAPKKSAPATVNQSECVTGVPHWPEPLAEEAFHGIAGEIVRAIEPHSESDPAALLIQFLVAFGNVIGNGAHMQAEADRHSCNLFAGIIGVTSKGRKGTSWGHIRRIFERGDERWASTRIQSGLSSGEGLVWAVHDEIKRQELTRVKGHITGYETVVADPGVADKRLLVVETELASTLRVMARDGNTLSPRIREAWDRGDLRTLVKNDPAVATRAHISIVAHITRDELRRHLDSTEAANGFANRFLWVCATRSKVLPEGGKIEQVDFAPLVKKLSRSVELARVAGELHRDEIARSAWANVYPELSEGKPGLFGCVTGRGEAQVLRLSLIYALLDGAKAIRAEHLLAALAVWQYCEASARYIFGDRLGFPEADRILGVLRNSQAGLTRTEIRDLFSRHQGGPQIDTALNYLAEHGLARRDVLDSGGRPTEVWKAIASPGGLGRDKSDQSDKSR